MRPGLAPVRDDLSRLNASLDEARARLARVEEHLSLDARDQVKYESELEYWRWLIKKGGSEKDFKQPFDVIFGRWQRERLIKLGVFLGLVAAPEPGCIDDWCATRSVVEIGAGPYPSIAAAQRGFKRCVAVDPIARGYVEEELVPAAASHVIYIEAPGERVPLPTGFADLVINENCLDHVRDPESVVAEMHRLLKPGGHLWLFVDLSNHQDHMHPHPMNEQKIRGLLRRFETLREEVSSHKAHPEAYGGYRVLARKPLSPGSGRQMSLANVVDTNVMPQPQSQREKAEPPHANGSVAHAHAR